MVAGVWRLGLVLLLGGWIGDLVWWALLMGLRGLCDFDLVVLLLLCLELCFNSVVTLYVVVIILCDFLILLACYVLPVCVLLCS